MTILSLTFISCDSDDSNDLTNENLKLIKIDSFDSENNLTATTNYIYDTELQLIAQRDENGNDILPTHMKTIKSHLLQVIVVL